jgi:hypothetical protein
VGYRSPECKTSEDTMKRTLLIGSVLAALLVPFAAAQAHGVAVSVNTPEFGIRIGAPVYRPVVPVYAPPPVVYAPPRVVYAPPPVVYAPPRVFYAPPRVVYVPAYTPYPYAGVRVAPYRHGHWKHRHDDDHDSDHRHRHYRAGYGF